MRDVFQVVLRSSSNPSGPAVPASAWRRAYATCSTEYFERFIGPIPFRVGTPKTPPYSRSNLPSFLGETSPVVAPRELPILPFQRLHPVPLFGRQARSAPRVTLGLAHPMTQRLGSASESCQPPTGSLPTASRADARGRAPAAPPAPAPPVSISSAFPWTPSLYPPRGGSNLSIMDSSTADDSSIHPRSLRPLESVSVVGHSS